MKPAMKTLSIISTAAAPLAMAAVAFFAQQANADTTRYATRLLEYRPAPGQFLNLDITTDSLAVLGPVGQTDNSSGDASTSDIVSLGGFGGYIILGFGQPIVNDPQNPYGVDFTVFGNALGNGASCEPAAVQVMKDLNGNGLPDDGPWLELAGSDYWLASTRRNVSFTYTNPGYNNAHAVPYTTSFGTSGAILSVDAHTQPYYPDPYIFQSIPGDGYTLTGSLIEGALDMRNSRNITSRSTPGFGYADANFTHSSIATASPANPYYDDENGNKADGFDISWAVDADGNHVELDQIDFIRIYTAMSANQGWLGENSPEIAGVAVTNPDPEYTPQDYWLNYLGTAPLQVIKGTTAQFEGLCFKNGQPVSEGTPVYSVDDPTIGTIDNNGLFTALNEGTTTVRFSQCDMAPEDVVEVTVTSLVSVGFDSSSSSTPSTSATASCIVGEKLYIPVVSLDNANEVLDNPRGNRFCRDTYRWYNSKPAVGIVDAYGTFTAISKGSTVLTVESQTDPNLYAEIKVTVIEAPEATLRNSSITIPADAPAGVWTSPMLFRTANQSTVFITSATCRNGSMPIELKGNRIAYDCSGIASFTDILDLEVTHYGVAQQFSIEIEFINDETSVDATYADSHSATKYQLYNIAGNIMASGHLYARLPESPKANDMANLLKDEGITDNLAPGIYILHFGDKAFKFSVRK